jgi:hypothetical protein
MKSLPKKLAQGSPTSFMLALLFFGIGLGILMTYPVVQTHPLRYAGFFILVSLIVYFYPSLKK